MDAVLFSSQTEDWETPQDLFDRLNEEFQFTLDVCASAENAKLNNFYSKNDNSLVQEWGTSNWMNPPYGRDVGNWVKKARENPRTVCLLPARTDTRWFHDYIYQNPNAEVRFIKGRLKFGGSTNSAPFPSLIAIFN